MSGMVYKSVLRAEIKELRGKGRTEAFAFFRPLLGEPEDIEVYEGEVEYFAYEEKAEALVPVQELSNRSNGEKRWGVDYVLSYSREDNEGEDSIVSLASLNEISLELTKKFGIEPSSVRVLSYSWYNGGDEPILFE